MSKKYYVLSDEWFYALREDIENLKKYEYKESRNEGLDEIIRVIKNKFKEYDVKIVEE